MTYTIGFDDDRIQLKEHSEILKGDFLIIMNLVSTFQVCPIVRCQEAIRFMWIKITM